MERNFCFLYKLLNKLLFETGLDKFSTNLIVLYIHYIYIILKSFYKYVEVYKCGKHVDDKYVMILLDFCQIGIWKYNFHIGRNYI